MDVLRLKCPITSFTLSTGLIPSHSFSVPPKMCQLRSRTESDNNTIKINNQAYYLHKATCNNRAESNYQIDCLCHSFDALRVHEAIVQAVHCVVLSDRAFLLKTKRKV